MSARSVSRVRRAVRGAIVVAAAALSAGCFATRTDVRLLQADVLAARQAAARADSLRAAQLDRVIAQLGVVGDSLRAVSTRSARFEGDAREALRNVGEQLITVQELTGQSQRRLQELRASLEARAEAAVPPAGDTTAAAGGAAAPGPNQLYDLALGQFRAGSYGTARSGFEELLRLYPTSDVAADAQFFVAEAFAAERNAPAADSAYAAVVTRYPSSARAATALYKRARQRQGAGRTAEARAMFEDVLRRFPRSSEADLACEALGRRAGCARR